MVRCSAEQEAQRECCLLPDDTVTERLQLLVSGQPDRGVCDMAGGQAHHPFDESGRQAVCAVSAIRGRGRRCYATADGFPSSDGWLVLAPGNI